MREFAGHRALRTARAALRSASGLLAALARGYPGGHLALRLGAGASHAESIRHLTSLGWQDLCTLAELPAGLPVRRQLGDLSVLAVRDGEAVHVLTDRCAHLGGPLHQGRLTGTVGATGAGGAACVTCPWHGSTFRLSDGAVLRGPSTVSQPTFEARIADGLIQVRPA